MTGWQELDVKGRPIPEPSVRPRDPQLRKAHRESIRRSVAVAKVAGVRVEAVLQQIRELEERKDQFAAEHLSTCNPLREQIAAIDQAAVNSMFKHGTIDEKAEQRRSKLLAEIHQAGVLLDKQHDQIDAELAPLHAQRLELAPAAHIPTIEADLFATADPKLIERYRLAKKGLLYGVSVEDAYQACIDE